MSRDEALRRADALALAATTSRPRDWTRLVADWRRFVGEVENGYQFTIYEYHNDLDTRGTIEDVLSRLDADDRQVLHDDVESIDRRFDMATHESDEVIATYDRGFWARRIPTKLVGELTEDLGG